MAFGDSMNGNRKSRPKHRTVLDIQSNIECWGLLVSGPRQRCKGITIEEAWQVEPPTVHVSFSKVDPRERSLPRLQFGTSVSCETVPPIPAFHVLQGDGPRAYSRLISTVDVPSHRDPAMLSSRSNLELDINESFVSSHKRDILSSKYH